MFCSGVHFTGVHEETLRWTSHSHLPCESVAGVVHIHQDIGQHTPNFQFCQLQNVTSLCEVLYYAVGCEIQLQISIYVICSRECYVLKSCCNLNASQVLVAG